MPAVTSNTSAKIVVSMAFLNRSSLTQKKSPSKSSMTIMSGQVCEVDIVFYDTAKAPYQRVLSRKDISVEAKAPLVNIYHQLNPAKLHRSIDQKIAKLWKFSRQHFPLMQR